MNVAFLVVTVLFTLVALAMVLIILVQRPSGGGLAGAFGGAGGSGSDTVFGGRVGDALTWATVAAFVIYLGLAITLNLLDEIQPSAATGATGTSQQAPTDDATIQPIPGDDQEITPDNNNPGGLDDSVQPPAEKPAENNADDSAGDSPDDKLDPTTNNDPPNPPGGDN